MKVKSLIALVLVGSAFGCSSGGDTKFTDQAPPPSSGAQVESNPNKKLIGGESAQPGAAPAAPAPKDASRDQSVN